MTELVAVLAQLKEERAKLDRAIAALSVVGGKSGREKRRLSVAAPSELRMPNAEDGQSKSQEST